MYGSIGPQLYHRITAKLSGTPRISSGLGGFKNAFTFVAADRSFRILIKKSRGKWPDDALATSIAMERC